MVVLMTSQLNISAHVNDWLRSESEVANISHGPVMAFKFLFMTYIFMVIIFFLIYLHLIHYFMLNKSSELFFKILATIKYFLWINYMTWLSILKINKLFNLFLLTLITINYDLKYTLFTKLTQLSLRLPVNKYNVADFIRFKKKKSLMRILFIFL